MFRIDLRLITRRIDFPAFSEELFALAQVVVGQAVELPNEALEARFGVPTLPDGQACHGASAPWVSSVVKNWVSDLMWS